MKNIKYFVIGSIISIIAFITFYNNSYCAQSTLIGQTLLNSYSIASEYYAARAGRNIIDASETSTDIIGIGGINDGTFSTDYNKMFSDNAEITINYIMSNIRDVDVSELTLEEKAKLASIMAATNNVPYAYKCFTLGGISLYFAVNELGDWIGDSYDNIVARFDNMTNSKISAVDSVAETDFPYNSSISASDTWTMSFLYGDGTKSSMFWESTDGALLIPCTPASGSLYTFVVLKQTGGSYNVKFKKGTTNSWTTYNQNMNTSRQLPNGWYYTSNSWSLSGSYIDPIYNNLPSVESVYNYLQNNYNNMFKPYSSELLNTAGVPYTVPDLDGYGTTISDLYPIVESLRGAIISLPSAGDVASALSGALEGAIYNAIEAIKALEIALPIEDEQDIITEPIDFTGTTIPIGFPSEIFEPITEALNLNFGIFSFFEPLFYLFGTFNGIFALWTFVPLLIIILLIVWALK